MCCDPVFEARRRLLQRERETQLFRLYFALSRDDEPDNIAHLTLRLTLESPSSCARTRIFFSPPQSRIPVLSHFFFKCLTMLVVIAGVGIIVIAPSDRRNIEKCARGGGAKKFILCARRGMGVYSEPLSKITTRTRRAWNAAALLYIYIAVSRKEAAKEGGLLHFCQFFCKTLRANRSLYAREHVESCNSLYIIYSVTISCIENDLEKVTLSIGVSVKYIYKEDFRFVL